MQDAMLAAIFKAVREETVPESYVGSVPQAPRTKVGCDIVKIGDFRSLPVQVQDDLMRAEILPTMWPLLQELRLRASLPLPCHDSHQEGHDL